MKKKKAVDSTKINPHRWISYPKLLAALLICFLLIACQGETPNTTLETSLPTEVNRVDGLTNQEADTLSSLKLVDFFPLYTMTYYGGYDHRMDETSGALEKAQVFDPDLANPSLPITWGCSLFAALGDHNNMYYGRNFDWDFSPALLLFTAPPDGYASVSMVDIAYLGFGDIRAATLTKIPLEERSSLLDAPFLPFDGMNERGLAVGMAAVPPGGMLPDPQKDTTDSLMVIRMMLDYASTVDEAVEILGNYNIDYGSGPPLHYLIADAAGDSILVEFYKGEMMIIPNEKPWHLATNFLRSSVAGSAKGVCERYDWISSNLAETEGQITGFDAMDLLSAVSQQNTQWSVVYGISTGEITLVMGRRYDQTYTFSLEYSER